MATPQSFGLGTATTVRVEPHPTELPLFVLVALASLGVWVLLAVSIIGLAYVLLIALFFLLAHLALITYVRGSAVRLGPAQFPDLYRRVEALSQRAGLGRVPEAFLMQADGSLNAFATRFLRSNLIVLFADLLEACGEDDKACDMVIGHELGHVRAGHLRWHWFLLPGMLVPFLGAAYSRAREFTCDRYGTALCGDPAAAVRGLAILAAGGRHAPAMNVAAFVDQQRDLDTGLMTIGRWLSTYPPLSERISAIQPALLSQPRGTRGVLRALLILGVLAATPVALGAAALAAFNWSGLGQLLDRPGARPTIAAGDPDKNAQVGRDHAAIAALVREEVAAGRGVPDSWDALAAAWARRYPDTPVPTDPYAGGAAYGYIAFDDGPLVYSAGPDGESATDDDIDHVVSLGGS